METASPRRNVGDLICELTAAPRPMDRESYAAFRAAEDDLARVFAKAISPDGRECSGHKQAIRAHGSRLIETIGEDATAEFLVSVVAPFGLTLTACPPPPPPEPPFLKFLREHSPYPDNDPVYGRRGVER